MKKTFETVYGLVEVRDAMIDTDGTNLEEGVDVRLDGEPLAGTVGITVAELNKDNIHSFTSNLVNL
jgi:hypothetical protein